YIAFGMIFALFIDATIVRMLLVPAVMHLLREDNWWAPKFIHKAYEKMGHGSEPQLEPVAAPESAEEELDDAAEYEVEEEEETEPEEYSDHDEGPSRSGRTIDDDDSLIPFSELMERLAQERSSLDRARQRRELPQANDEEF